MTEQYTRTADPAGLSGAVEPPTADTAAPDAATPDTATPDTATPDTATPDTAAPDTAAPAPADPPAAPATKAKVEDVEEALKDVVDPELGINVVDLGLVYGLHVDDENVATVDMTLTSAACPLTDVIEDQAQQALCTGPGGGLVNEVRINWVWMPPWGPDKITDDGREQLRSLGFNV